MSLSSNFPTVPVKDDAAVSTLAQPLGKAYRMNTVVSTANFVIETVNLPSTDDRMMHPKPVVSKESPLLFTIRVHHRNDPDKILWHSAPGIPFIRSAAGEDSLTPGNGEYRIVQNNQFTTTHQTVSSFVKLPLDGDDDSELFQGVAYEGLLLYQPSARLRAARRQQQLKTKPPLDEPVAVLSYTFKIQEFSESRLDLSVSVVPLNGSAFVGNYDRVMITYLTQEDEEVFGLGEQFSYWSLKKLRVPIISREQGIGRGLQPITYILNHIPPRNPGYSGADSLSTYTAVGHYITSQSRSVYLHNTELAFFDFTEINRTTIEVASTRAKVSVFYGARPLDILNAYTASISGRMRRMPLWTSEGAVVGIQGGQDKVLDAIDKLKQSGVKISAVWLQDWVGMREQPLELSFPIPFLIPGFPSRSTAILGIKSTSPQKRLWWNWEHDLDSYPEWPAFVAKLKDEHGIKVLTYINPFLSDVEKGGKPHVRNYFEEARSAGYLVKRWEKFILERPADQDAAAKKLFPPPIEWRLVDYIITSGPGLSAGMIDLSNPAAFEWYKNLIKINIIGQGVYGWMADFAEYMPFDGVLFEHQLLSREEFISNHHQTTSAFHNVYPREWARLNREAVDEVGGDYAREAVFFSRSASVDSPKFSHSFWNGDQMHTWDHLDGLESTVYGTLSATLSGLAYIHSDIGGYTTLNVDSQVSIKVGNRTSFVKVPALERRARFVRQDMELFERWQETNVFLSTSMYRTHEGSVPNENLQVWTNPELAKKFAYFINLFTSLSDYRQMLVKEYESHGYPLIRSLFLHYPDKNQAAASMERLQFLLGPLLCVIPITTPTITKLNEKIAESRNQDPDGDEEDPEDVLETIRRSIQDQTSEGAAVSSDEEEIVFEEEQEPGKRSMKGRFLRRLQTWAGNSILTTIRVLFGSVTIKDDAELPVDARWPVYQNASLKIRQQRAFRAKSLITAPTTLPKPAHGRPYLPPGTWRHVWSGTVFTVTDPNGLFLTDSTPQANLSCLPGEPAVFVREFVDSEMSELLKPAMNLATRSAAVAGGEDWRYWLDGIEDTLTAADILANFDKGLLDAGQLRERALRKYRLLADSLQPFLKMPSSQQYPRNDTTTFSVLS